MYLVSLKIIKFEMRMSSGVLLMIDDAFLDAWYRIFQILVHEPKEVSSPVSFKIFNTVVGILVEVGPQRWIQSFPRGFVCVLKVFNIHSCISFLSLNIEFVVDMASLQIIRGFNCFEFECFELVSYRS